MRDLIVCKKTEVKKPDNGLYRINIHIERGLMQKFKSKAYARGCRSMSECLRGLIKDYVRR